MLRRLVLKNKKYVVIGLLLATVLGVGGCSLKKNIEEVQEKKTYTVQSVINDNKVLQKEMIVEALSEVESLEVLQGNISKVAKLEQGKYFKKEKSIKFKALVHYKVDLSKIDNSNVIVNGNEIKVFMSEPTVSIEFLEDKTEYSDTKNSFLSFGDLELTVEEFEQIKVEVKEAIHIEAMKEIELAKEKTSKAIESIVEKFTKTDMEVGVNFVK